MVNKKNKWPMIFFYVLLALMPFYAFGSVESSMQAIQDKLINTILPLAAILGLCMAGLSFMMGNEKARSHLILAIIGAGIGFGAQSIVAFIRALVN